MTAAEMPRLHAYWPELGGTAPANADAFSRLWPNGGKYTLRVRPGVERLTGRGVTFECVETEGSLRPGSKFVGFSKYVVTRAALTKISRELVVASEALLD